MSEDATQAAAEITAALEEAREAYNAAKKHGGKARISTRSLWLLVSGYCVMADIPLHDAKTGRMIHDPSGGAPNPSAN